MKTLKLNTNDAQISKILSYVKEKYSTDLEFLWIKFPANAILRRKDNSKWYGALLNISCQKLGLYGEYNVNIFNVKCDAGLADCLIDKKSYFPAYHMNKKTWITILLDGSVSMDKIFRLIDMSYDMTKK